MAWCSGATTLQMCNIHHWRWLVFYIRSGFQNIPGGRSTDAFALRHYLAWYPETPSHSYQYVNLPRRQFAKLPSCQNAKMPNCQAADIQESKLPNYQVVNFVKLLSCQASVEMILILFARNQHLCPLLWSIPSLLLLLPEPFCNPNGLLNK